MREKSEDDLILRYSYGSSVIVAAMRERVVITFGSARDSVDSVCAGGVRRIVVFPRGRTCLRLTPRTLWV